MYPYGNWYCADYLTLMLIANHFPNGQISNIIEIEGVKRTRTVNNCVTIKNLLNQVII